MKFHDGEGLRLGVLGFRGSFDGDFPGGLIGRRADGEDGAGATVKDGRSDALFPQELSGIVDGVALSDSAEIKHDPGAPKTNGEVFGVEFDELHADGLARLLDGFRSRSLSGPAHEAPAADERGDGDIERAVSFG